MPFQLNQALMLFLNCSGVVVRALSQCSVSSSGKLLLHAWPSQGSAVKTRLGERWVGQGGEGAGENRSTPAAGCGSVPLLLNETGSFLWEVLSVCQKPSSGFWSTACPSNVRVWKMIAELGVLKISLFSLLVIQRNFHWKGCIASQAS